jgi:hypothetical protein
VEDETLDFFASGHPLVEAIFAHFDESSLGRVARFQVEIGREGGEGLVAVYKEGREFEVIAFDSVGKPRPEWAAAFREPSLQTRRVVDDAADRREWKAMVRRLASCLDPARRPHALAAIVVGPISTGPIVI